MSLFDRLRKQSPQVTAPMLPDASAIGRLKAALAQEGLPAEADHEMRRILELPICTPITPEEIEDISRRVVVADKFERERFRLFPSQAWLLREYDRYGGRGLGHIIVGGGKTFSSLLLAQRAFDQGVSKILLLTKPEVYDQLVVLDIPSARKHFTITVPFHEMRRSAAERRMLAESGRRGCYIFTYSLLSARDGQHVLEAIAPDLVIADEAHMLRNRSSARTARFLSFARKHPFNFIPMSGTLTARSIRDYHHLVTLALRENSPMPMHAMTASDWSMVVDSGAQPTSVQERPMFPLLKWATKSFPGAEFPPTVQGYRAAYERRLSTAPGVVKFDEGVGTSLNFVNLRCDVADDYPGRQKVTDLTQQVEAAFLTPNGDEIEHAMQCWKWIEELSAGFYNQLTWPTPQVWAKRKGIEEEEADAMLGFAQDHHRMQQLYHSALRKWLKSNRKKGLDTPFLVGQDMQRHGDANVGAHLFAAWREMKDRQLEDMPERIATAVRVCDFKVAEAAKWVAESVPKDEGAIVWYHHQEIGRWLAEMIGAGPRGADLLFAPSEGDRSGINRLILDREANKKKIIVASITAHGEGKNLQYLSNMLVVQWPRSAKTSEQLIGRLLRPGQEADELNVFSLRTTPHDHMSFGATLNDALYIHQSTGARQKLVLGTYTPLPEVYATEFLEAKGLQPEKLDDDQRRAFQDRFGAWRTSA